ncbi:hypothetical protein H6G74_30550 [Nostoc spongiaeforme FACHB-130]|uniref:Uncharacterized protein n=1 Tax=Nostoc spongiaeforme FACHB-130 TaxID=1357510 RepID=A0ABR8G5P9_9NOSO|nr:MULTISPECIES: hypothetical protein [Nostoc]MBD2302279.1 hypothetical protein [Nostoc sp. FACHB-190]MBD2598605.1 hypothetical protein [Nostoc spongiaeforme FACHB-130]
MLRKLEELSNSELIQLFESATIFDDEGDLMDELENFTKERFGKCFTIQVDVSVHDIYRELARRFVNHLKSNNL